MADDADTADAVARAARARVLESHGDWVRGVVEAADAVAAGWDGAETSGGGAATTDRTAVVEPLGDELASAGLLDRTPVVLADAVAAAGYDLPAEPVPAPPYVVVTGRGPVLRATVADGRVVVVLAVFRVERDPVRYVRTGDDPESVVEVEFVPG